MDQRSPDSYQKMQELSSLSQAQQLAIALPEIQFYRNSRGLVALCPFHDDKSIGSFLFNPRTGVWKCFSCGESGQGAIGLLMRVRSWKFLQALDYLYMHRNDSIPPTKSVPPALKSGSKLKLTYRASTAKAETPSKKLLFTHYGSVTAEDRHLIYKAFAESSPLTNAERLALQRNRGLSYGDTWNFFHMPAATDELFWIDFLAKLSEYDEHEGQNRLYYRLLGTPGFFWDEDKDCVSFVYRQDALGMLLHSPAGLISGIDMRVSDDLDAGEGKAARYIGFSSGSICGKHPEQCSMGTKLEAFVDVVPSYYAESSRKFKGYAITEGKFKSIHLSKRGYTALSVRGVGNWKRVIEMLHEMAAVKAVTIAFDADAATNQAVAKASRDLGRALLKEGYAVQYLTWDLADGKGFDDLCNAGLYSSAEIVPAEQYLSEVLQPRAVARKAM